MYSDEIVKILPGRQGVHIWSPAPASVEGAYHTIWGSVKGRSVGTDRRGGETMNKKEWVDRLTRRQKAKTKTLLKCLLAVTIPTPEHLEQVELYLDALTPEGGV
jgi:hypothetical protein